MQNKEMLINVSEGEECRIALVENGRLEELYMERTSSTSHVGNVYKGRVTNVEPSIQAAFIDFGLGRNGFLHISDLMPTYFGRAGDDIKETVGRKMARRDRPPIQRCLRRGDEIIVQIIKEGIGTKGPTLSTYVSIPGRILVMMPGMSKLGVSRKIEDEEERRRLRQILDSLKPPKDCGFIIRTAGVGKSKTDIQKDLTYLTRLWLNIDKKIKSGPGPTELYTEGDLVTRTVRDVFTPDIERIVIDNIEVARRVKDFIKIAMPRTRNKVEEYDGAVPLFHEAGIEREIEQMYSRHVPLPSGGSLVIDSTEAIVAIDVNSGKFRDHADAETTAFKTDMEAADEIARQLRLRDLGGVIICDFIDLRYERHRRDLEKRLHDNLRNDRAKTKMLRMSQFGIIEMTRQRMRPSLKRSVYFDCPHCKGSGLVKTPESMALDVMRKLAIAINDQRVNRVELGVCPEVAFYLQNKKRAALASLEGHWKKRIVLHSVPTLGLDEMRLELFDMRDGLVFLDELGMLPPAQQPQGRGHPPHGRPPQRQDRGRPQQQPRRPERRDREEEWSEEGHDDGRREHRDEPRPPARPQPQRQEQRDQGRPQQPSRGERPGRGRGRDPRGRDWTRDQRPRDEMDQQAEAPLRQESPEHEDAERYDMDSVEDAVEQREEALMEEAAGLAEPIAPPPAPIEMIDDVSMPEPPRADGAQAFDALDDDQQPEAEPAGPEVIDEEIAEAPEPPAEEAAQQPRQRGRRGGRGRPRGRAADPAKTVEAAPESPEVESGETEAAPPKKKTRRGKRGGRGRGKKAGGAAQASDNGRRESGQPPPPTPTVRTGSTDRHMFNDEPVIPPPAVRPRTYRDLDQIPDDFD